MRWEKRSLARTEELSETHSSQAPFQAAGMDLGEESVDIFEPKEEYNGDGKDDFGSSLQCLNV